MYENLLSELEQAGVSVKETLGRFMNRESMYVKFLGKFPKDPACGGLKDAISREDLSEAFRHAHTLKGVAGNLGLDNLLAPLGPVVEALRGGQKPDQEKLQECFHQHQVLCDIINKHL